MAAGAGKGVCVLDRSANALKVLRKLRQTTIVCDPGVSVRPRAFLAHGLPRLAERDRVTAWLQHLPDMRNRRIVCFGAGALHRGETRLPSDLLKGAIE